jgi:hypothetical protein
MGLMRVLRNQRGAALLLAVVVIVVMLLTLTHSLTNQLGFLQDQVAREKRTLGGMDGLRDFAVIARRAHEIWMRDNPAWPTVAAGACSTAGTTRTVAGAPFCFPTGIPGNNNADCIRDPFDQRAAPRLLCIYPGAGEGTIEVVAKANPEWNWFDRGRWHLDGYREIAMEKIRSFSRSLENTAQAQTSEIYWPTLAGAPAATIAANANYTCVAATPPSAATFCKKCTLNPADANRLDCLFLRVCLRNAGCPAAGDWLTQSVGIIRTM